jgi:DNA repair exonuclease SbcCD ATPase subunit
LPLETASRLEELLEESGLLDALIAPGDAEKTLLQQGLGDRWIRPAPIEQGRTLADFLVPAECGVAPAEIEAALRSVPLDEAPSQWKLGPLEGTATRRAEPAILYIGAANRRRERERQIARLEARLLELKKQHERIQAEIETLQDRGRVLTAAMDEVKEKRTEVDAATQWLNECQQALERSEKIVEQSRGALVQTRTAYEQSLASVPEARGRTADGVRDLQTFTQEAQSLADRLYERGERLRMHRRKFGEVQESIRGETRQLSELSEDRSAAEKKVSELSARRDAAAETL